MNSPDFAFPHILVISASAGTGKTHELSKRIARYLLAESNEVPFNNLRNILAITFTVNASKEMKKRVLKWLKGLCLNKDDFFCLLEINDRKVSKKAELLVNEILSNYKDFQIKTIDSFLTSIFKASAISFGFSATFEVLLNNREYLEKAFNLYLDEIKDKHNELFQVIELINNNEDTFSFTPYEKIFNYVKNLYVKERHFPLGFTNTDKSQEWSICKKNIQELAKEIKEYIDNNGLAEFLNQNGLLKMISDIENNNFEVFFTRGEKTEPVKAKYKNLNGAWVKKIDEYWELLKSKRQEALNIYSVNYFYPYIKVLRSFGEKIDYIKRSEEIIFIEDIPHIILQNLNENNIPEIYMYLGGKLYHYFIDEFQDTSPIQWENLKILIENSLASSGSLYVVGDTKQAIYGFRDTDYRIMKGLCKDNGTFLSVSHRESRVLQKNYRSGEYILTYVKEVFDKAKNNSDYNDYGDSGLFDDWKVDVLKTETGYVKAKIVFNNIDDEDIKEKKELFDIIKDCKDRGYKESDITILANKNKNIVEISSWLNQKNIPFISYSSLDIRERKVVKEIIHLLRFLDNPKDNLSLSIFLLGEIFEKLADRSSIEKFILEKRDIKFLYKEFQKECSELWNKYFNKPFKYVGYLPLYELLISLINILKIEENFKLEGGAIAKLLEIVKDLEGKGKNSLKEFLDFFESKEEHDYESSQIFEIPIPENYNGIKLMTVHKAKGLSAKVVIYVVYEQKSISDSLKIYEDKKGITIMKINSKYVGLEDKYAVIKKRQMINDLNSFYVGLTRAEDELYVIGVSRVKSEETDKRVSFPVDLIITGEWGKKTKHRIIDKKSDEGINISLNLSGKFYIEETFNSTLNLDEIKRGEYIHAILSEIYTLDDLTQLKEIAQKYHINFPECDVEKETKIIEDFLNTNEVKPFFQVDRKSVLLEKSFSDLDGVIRVDRIIFKEEEILIVDFKTGEIDESYNEQLIRYGETLRAIYKKRVICCLLYIDLKKVVKIYECS